MSGEPGGGSPAVRPAALRSEQTEHDGLLSRLRWDPGRRGAMALGILVVIVLAGVGWWLAGSRPHEVPISAASSSATGAVTGSAPGSVPGALPSGGAAPSAGASGPATAATPSSGTAASSTIVVDVAGKARRPGIYRLPTGSRVYDALRAAGGARAGVSTLSLNLAEPLRDGEQIVVGGPPSAPPPEATGGSSGSSDATAVVDLNTATLEQLETLPGVGPVLGQHILDWRDAHGHFTSVDQLQQVSGIGDVRLAQLKPLVSL